MNFYGKEITEQHTLTGRVIPVLEALNIAVSKAAQMPVPEANHSKALPQWTHNLCAKVSANLFNGLVESAPKNNTIDAEKYGCIIGILLRGVVFYVNEVPAIWEKEGLNSLTLEQDAKLEKLAGLPQLFSIASNFFQKPVGDSDSLIAAGREHVEKKTEELTVNFGQILLYLLKRPVTEQSAFLDGIAKGFKVVLNDKGEFSGDKRRLDVYLALFVYWPEIAEMQNEPRETARIKTRLDLLEWLEKQEEKQLYTDPKAFFALCGEIGLDIGLPGHPTSSAKS